MTASRQQIFLFAGASFLFLLGTWQLPFLGPDEPRYAQIAREMFETGDLIVPKLGGFAWFEKPVLLYWLMALIYSVFGINEFAARLPSVLAATGSIWFLFFTIRRIVDHTSALLACSVLASSAFFVTFSHAATFDMLLAFCVTAALCSFLLFEHSNQEFWLYWMYIFTGIGILGKGLASPAIIGITLLGYFVISRNARSILQMKLLQGGAIVALVAAVWFLPISLIYGTRFWDEFIYQHHFVRYTSSYYHRSQGLFFYVPILLAGTYPWSFAPFTGKTGEHRLRRFAFCWLFFPFLFFSVSQSKLPGYILPAMPAFGILAGLSLANLKNKTRLIVLAVFVNFLPAVALFWAATKYSIPSTAVCGIAASIALLTVIGIIFVRQNKWTLAFISQSLIILSGMIIFLIWIFPQFPWSDSKNLSLRWVQQAPASAKIVPYNIYDFGPVFYTNGRMELNPQGYPNILTNASQLHRYLVQTGEAHVLVSNEELEWIKRAEFWSIKRVLEGRQTSIVELQPK